MSQIIKIMRTNNNSPNFKKPNESVQWLDKSIQILSAKRKSSTDNKYYSGLGYQKGKPYDLDFENVIKKFIYDEVIGVTYTEDKVYEHIKLVNDYYDTLIVDVPFKGLELEIGLYNDKAKLSKDNPPINVSDFLIYKAIFENNIEVAASKIEGSQVDYYRFYIHDLSNEDRNKRLQMEKSSVAIGHYEEIKEMESIVKTFISELGLPNTNSKDKNRMTLYEFILINAVKFEECFDDYTREKDSYINRLYLKIFINNDFIKITSSGKYIDGLSGLDLANSKIEMLAYIRNPENRETINGYKKKYQERNQLI